MKNLSFTDRKVADVGDGSPTYLKIKNYFRSTSGRNIGSAFFVHIFESLVKRRRVELILHETILTEMMSFVFGRARPYKTISV
ncbi:hypothetical protein [Helcococcus ovis]|uniref:hypothetical protein n=1 Tax=Helcococcus ovis TaxID=72026 RepID=UPI0038BBA932